MSVCEREGGRRGKADCTRKQDTFAWSFLKDPYYKSSYSMSILSSVTIKSRLTIKIACLLFKIISINGMSQNNIRFIFPKNLQISGIQQIRSLLKKFIADFVFLLFSFFGQSAGHFFRMMVFHVVRALPALSEGFPAY